MAIWSGSVSPSRSTKTGAFMLRDRSATNAFPVHNATSPQAGANPPDLQRPGAQDAGLLVLGHERGGGALVVGDLLVLVRLVVALAVVGGGVGVARRDDVVGVLVLGVLVGGAGRLVVVGRLGLG